LKNILLVSGFVCDTFSSIEMLSIYLSEAATNKYNIIWLVPTIGNRYNRFTNAESREKMTVPLYVKELQKRSISYVEADVSKYNILKNMFLFWAIFRKYKIDAVLTQFGFERFYAAFFGKLFSKKTIWHERWFSLDTRFVFLKKIFYRLFVDCFIAVSEHLGSTLPEEKKTFVVHNGMSIKPVPLLSKTERNKLKDKLGLGKYNNIVIMIAAFRDYKNYDIAVQIVEKVCSRQADPDIGFVFLGDGPLLNKYKAEIKTKKLDSFVVIPGHKLNVADYLSVSDVMMLTSHYGEGLPNCLLEGMNFKLPLIAFNMEWAGEIIKHNENGYLIPRNGYDDFAGCIISLISSREKRELMGAKGYEMFVDNFDINIWKKKIMGVLKQVI
jgi:glycosyltransferase involved in cell wall biosynthesis